MTALLADNPLMMFQGLVAFDRIRPEHVTPAIDALLREAKETVAGLERSKAEVSWDSFVEPLDSATERLTRAWKSIEHLNAVADSPELRAAYNANLPRVTEFWTNLAQSEALFAKFKALGASKHFNQLSKGRRRTIENALRDFRLGGAELNKQDQARFAEIQEQLAGLGQRFLENLLDATNAYALYVDDVEELSGMPQDAIAAARQRAEHAGRKSYKLTLEMPCYLAVMQFAERRDLRRTLYENYAKRASEFGDASRDNTSIIVDTLRLRGEQAHLLGLSNYAELSLVAKMADSPAEVVSFLHDLAARAKPYAERDVKELRAFAQSEFGIEALESWDVTFVSERLREKRYAFSEQEVKQYFPEPKVLAGLFQVIETLFSVHIRPDVAPTWHKDVRFYRVESHNGELLAQFYLDLYARPSKRSGAWMDDARSRRRIGRALQTPIAFLNCNFSEPINGRAALFSHDEVTTLFHEFGHGLHHMLTQVEEMPVSGIHGVEWDAVELPSQFLENFCWEWNVLKHLTGHVETGTALPRILFDKMVAAKNFQVGIQTLRQVEYGLFDMMAHTEFKADGRESVQDLLEQVRDTVAVLRPPRYHRFANQFSHVFAGGYAAGYYSYKWAEVLSADAYAKFEEDGVLNPVTGALFRDEILGVGGSRPALESFTSFRGRPPSIDALLRHNGMSDS
jgi:oligopeptidase A